jgi:prepilin-type N-terminal cleavage/methylation domain-containing protein
MNSAPAQSGPVRRAHPARPRLWCRHPACLNRETRATGFTLPEMLIVIGILVILIGILVPVATRVRKAGYSTASAASLAALQGAIEVYYANFRAYPGPVSNATVCGQPGLPQNIGPNSLTMSENLVLGLEGGLFSNAGAPTFDPTRVGRGPMGLGNGKQYDTFLKVSVPKSAGRFSNSANSVAANDSNVPEYMDSFPDNTLPFLYYRANVGAASMVGGAFAQTQYDPAQNIAYTGVAIGPPEKPNLAHGLRIAGNPTAAPSGGSASDLGPYLYGSRGKDSYILIGAGIDRTYGTGDDNTSFGRVLP